MSTGDNQTSTLHGRTDQDRLQPHSPAQQSGENFNGIGENGTNDLGDFGNIAGGMGLNNDTGSATGQQSGEEMDPDGRKLFSDKEDEENDDLGDGASGSSAGGVTI